MTNDAKPKRSETYYGRAHANAFLEGEQSKENTLSSPQSYPKLPPSSPWSNDPVGPEPPLGVAIDHMGDGS
jgi:hypothetical protein